MCVICYNEHCRFSLFRENSFVEIAFFSLALRMNNKSAVNVVLRSTFHSWQSVMTTARNVMTVVCGLHLVLLPLVATVCACVRACRGAASALLPLSGKEWNYSFFCSWMVQAISCDNHVILRSCDVMLSIDG